MSDIITSACLSDLTVISHSNGSGTFRNPRTVRISGSTHSPLASLFLLMLSPHS